MSSICVIKHQIQTELCIFAEFFMVMTIKEYHFWLAEWCPLRLHNGKHKTKDHRWVYKEYSPASNHSNSAPVWKLSLKYTYNICWLSISSYLCIFSATHVTHHMWFCVMSGGYCHLARPSGNIAIRLHSSVQLCDSGRIGGHSDFTKQWKNLSSQVDL